MSKKRGNDFYMDNTKMNPQIFFTNKKSIVALELKIKIKLFDFYNVKII